MTGIHIKNVTWQEFITSLHSHTCSAVKKNKKIYANRLQWKILKRIPIPIGTKRKLASTFYQLKLGHSYTKAYVAKFGRSDSDRCSCGAVQTTDNLLLSCKWFHKE